MAGGLYSDVYSAYFTLEQLGLLCLETSYNDNIFCLFLIFLQGVLKTTLRSSISCSTLKDITIIVFNCMCYGMQNYKFSDFDFRNIDQSVLHNISLWLFGEISCYIAKCKPGFRIRLPRIQLNGSMNKCI